MGSNPLRTVLGAATLGVSEMIYKGQEAEKSLGDMQNQDAPPTPGDAAKSLAKNDPTKIKTYGRTGTIMNQGGRSGIASSMLDLSSPTLLGKS